MTISIDILMVSIVVASILGLFLLYWLTKLGINAVLVVREYCKDKTPVSKEVNDFISLLKPEHCTIVQKNEGIYLNLSKDKVILIRTASNPGVWIDDNHLNNDAKWNKLSFFNKKEYNLIQQKAKAILAELVKVAEINRENNVKSNFVNALTSFKRGA